MAFCDISGGFLVLVCGDGVRSVFYQLVKLGWFPLPTSSGGLLPLRGVLLSGELGQSIAEASDIWFSGNVMAFGHLVRPARSASKVCVGFAGAPLWVPLKICVFRREDGRLQRDCSGRRRRGHLGEACRDVVVFFVFVKGAFVSVGM